MAYQIVSREGLGPRTECRPGHEKFELFFGIVYGNSREHKDFMGEEDAKMEVSKDDELVSVEGLIDWTLSKTMVVLS